MELSYDPRYNIAYLKLKDAPTEVDTIHLSEAVNVDIAPDGTLYGIEFLNANEQIGLIPNVGMTMINKATGMKSEFVLP